MLTVEFFYMVVFAFKQTSLKTNFISFNRTVKGTSTKNQ